MKRFERQVGWLTDAIRKWKGAQSPEPEKFTEEPIDRITKAGRNIAQAIEADTLLGFINDTQKVFFAQRLMVHVFHQLRPEREPAPVLPSKTSNRFFEQIETYVHDHKEVSSVIVDTDTPGRRLFKTVADEAAREAADIICNDESGRPGQELYLSVIYGALRESEEHAKQRLRESLYHPKEEIKEKLRKIFADKQKEIAHAVEMER